LSAPCEPQCPVISIDHLRKRRTPKPE
jgi:hypothetical protein